MNTSDGGYARAVLTTAVRDLIRRALVARAALPATASERCFYLGVEAAAMEYLSPQLAMSRGARWLDHESVEFKEGYLRTQAVVSTAGAVDDPPLRLRLPEPSPSPASR